MRSTHSGLCLAMLLFAGPGMAAFINYASREINTKIVYVAVDDEVAHDNLAYIYARTDPDAKGKLIKLSTKQAEESPLLRLPSPVAR